MKDEKLKIGADGYPRPTKRQLLHAHQYAQDLVKSGKSRRVCGVRLLACAVFFQWIETKRAEAALKLALDARTHVAAVPASVVARMALGLVEQLGKLPNDEARAELISRLLASDSIVNLDPLDDPETPPEVTH